MNIFWHGQSCFEIISTQDKNNAVGVVIDPFDESIGLKLPRKLTADVVLVTHNHFDHNNVKRVEGSPFVITNPGEYDVKGVSINGVPAYHDNSKGSEKGQDTIYTIEFEDIKICHLGDLGQKELTSEQIEKIGDVDILMIPIGGGGKTIDATDAVKIISQIEPNITIPMHYHVPGLNIKLDGVEKFLKSLGIKSLQPIEKLSLKKKDLIEDEAKIIVLAP
jgi:L-ascorbate metabolism protein UlaG (beta-lactamase superfamily)